MRIDFNEWYEVTIPNHNGNGAVWAKMFMGPSNRVMISRIPVGASIGLHQHATTSEFAYVISGEGEAFCDHGTEALKPGMCHCCFKGSSHSIINTGDEDLVLFTVVSES